MTLPPDDDCCGVPLGDALLGNEALGEFECPKCGTLWLPVGDGVTEIRTWRPDVSTFVSY